MTSQLEISKRTVPLRAHLDSLDGVLDCRERSSLATRSSSVRAPIPVAEAHLETACLQERNSRRSGRTLIGYRTAKRGRGAKRASACCFWLKGREPAHLENMVLNSKRCKVLQKSCLRVEVQSERKGGSSSVVSSTSQRLLNLDRYLDFSVQHLGA